MLLLLHKKEKNQLGLKNVWFGLITRDDQTPHRVVQDLQVSAAKSVRWLSAPIFLKIFLRGIHRRRINTEVVTAVRGTKFIKFLAALAILNKDDLKNMMSFTRMI